MIDYEKLAKAAIETEPGTFEGMHPGQAARAALAEQGLVVIAQDELDGGRAGK